VETIEDGVCANKSASGLFPSLSLSPIAKFAGAPTVVFRTSPDALVERVVISGEPGSLCC